MLIKSTYIAELEKYTPQIAIWQKIRRNKRAQHDTQKMDLNLKIKISQEMPFLKAITEVSF